MNPKPIKTGFVLIPFIVILGIVLVTSCAGSSAITTSTHPENGNKSNIYPDALRVFVYNIQHGRGLDGEVNIERIADVIKAKDPHLVALNEVDVGVERSGNIDIMALLAKHLEMESVFGKNIPHQGGEYGNGILTNLPVLSYENLHLNMSEEGEQRGLLQTVVKFKGVKIAFMTTHLDHRSDINRQVAVEQIIEAKQNYPDIPIFVTGDFNARPGDGVIGRMKIHFNDTWDEVGEGPGYTIPAPGAIANRRIDYIFYSNNLVDEGEPALQPVHMEVINSSASDHLPIYGAFELIE